MKVLSLSALALLANIASSYPLSRARRTENIDVTILQFALTLEHLENVFYKQALGNLTQDAFMASGFDESFFLDLQFIVEDEQFHVELLTTAIQATGTTPVAACEYNFAFPDVQTFITLSSVLEGVGTSAYLGGAPLITDKNILTVAASIMVTEALHTSQQRTALGLTPAANALGTPLGPNGIFTLAASFIVSCPETNPPLPFKAFPSLAIADAAACPPEAPPIASEHPPMTPGHPQPVSSHSIKRRTDELPAYLTLGALPPPSLPQASEIAPSPVGHGVMPSTPPTHDMMPPPHPSGDGAPSETCPPPAAGQTVKFAAEIDIAAGSFLTFVSGVLIVSAEVAIDGKNIEGAIPEGVSGQSYVFVTNTAVNGTLMDGVIMAGPAILEVTPPKPTIDNAVL